MCLAIPMKVIELDGAEATVEQEGVTRNIRVDFLKDLQLGEYVLVHAGVAIERIGEEEAAETLELIKELCNETS
ncbi:MAG: HypC/HybG/HupF family hydrogenase formation chaperone [bacterium]